jgi:hypothetical protein
MLPGNGACSPGTHHIHASTALCEQHPAADTGPPGKGPSPSGSPAGRFASRDRTGSRGSGVTIVV